MNVQPYLSFEGRAQEAIDFYKAAFGATELFRIDAASGAVVAQLSVGVATFWVADESPEHSNFSPESLGGATARMVMVVDDPDAAFARGVAAGAKVVSPVDNQPYGWRVGRIVDPFGHHWNLATHTEDVAPAEMERRGKEWMAKMASMSKSAGQSYARAGSLAGAAETQRLPFQHHKGSFMRFAGYL